MKIKGSFDKDLLSLEPGSSGQVNLTVPPQPEKLRQITFDVFANSTGNATDRVTLSLEVTYPRVHAYIGDYTCLWIVLVAVCVFIVVKLTHRKLVKRRT
jgi:hypothetical protein